MYQEPSKQPPQPQQPQWGQQPLQPQYPQQPHYPPPGQYQLFKTTCKDGMLLVDEMNISVVAPFNRLVWSIPRNSVTNIIQKPSFLSTEVEIYSAHGVYVVQTLPKPKANELAALFVHSASPQLQPQQPQMKPLQAPIQTAPTGIPIDTEIQRIKMEIEQGRLQLSQINANMANIRSHYQQSHVHGGGKVGGFVRTMQRSSSLSERTV